MGEEANRTELGQFLKARRAELTPADLGLATDGEHRRVPGLRREEVAQLASISVQYYTRLEQGRLQASAPVLAALADVLRLDDDQHTYLLELAGKEAHRRRRPKSQEVRPQTRRLLDALGAPAIVLGRRMDILAWNPLAAALLSDFSQLPDKQRNYARLVFSDSEMRQRYANWEQVAPDCVAFLRMEEARHPDDPRLTELVGELSIKDPTSDSGGPPTTSPPRPRVSRPSAIRSSANSPSTGRHSPSPPTPTSNSSSGQPHPPPPATTAWPSWPHG